MSFFKNRAKVQLFMYFVKKNAKKKVFYENIK